MNKVLCFDDVLLVPQYSEVLSRSTVDLHQVFRGQNTFLKTEIPLVSAPMDTVTEQHMALAMSKLGGLGILHRYCSIEKQLQMIEIVHNSGGRAGVAIGATKDYLERFQAAHKIGARFFCVDIAHGDHHYMVEAIRTIRKTGLDAYIIAGNIATWDAAKTLAGTGADCLRIGVGSGSACTTRIVTGFGIPTLQSILNIAPKIREMYPEVAIMADGGIRNSGDAVKCLVAGAHLIMCGGLLAGTSESPGLTYCEQGEKKKAFRGMASTGAMKNLDDKRETTAEGVEHFVPYLGDTDRVIANFLGGIRSGASYAGIDKISKFFNSTEFVQISTAGLTESHPHVKL